MAALASDLNIDYIDGEQSLENYNTYIYELEKLIQKDKRSMSVFAIGLAAKELERIWELKEQ